ncbi:hypothetical protein [Pseudomonas sp.]|uniref:hypothetical protein n=1 Tax=Pseudomonas sp. TaxID=306 RepID=UPI0028A5C213|nr:hypothetical protein [Pseudomonas sp.]
MSQSEIDHQVEEAQYWLSVEVKHSGVLSARQKVAICREIVKCGRDSPRLEVKIALLTLVLAGEVKNPRSLTPEDIESALWLVRDNRLGFDPQAAISLR